MLSNHFFLYLLLLSTATNAAVWEFKEVAKRYSTFIHDKRLLDAHFPLRKLILDDRILDPMLIIEEMSDEGGFSGAEIAHQQINTSFVLHLI